MVCVLCVFSWHLKSFSLVNFLPHCGHKNFFEWHIECFWRLAYDGNISLQIRQTLLFSLWTDRLWYIRLLLFLNLILQTLHVNSFVTFKQSRSIWKSVGFSWVKFSVVSDIISTELSSSSKCDISEIKKYFKCGAYDTILCGINIYLKILWYLTLLNSVDFLLHLVYLERYLDFLNFLQLFGIVREIHKPNVI